MNDFYLTLASNTRVVSNTSSAFRVPLPYNISLDGPWQVGLAEIQYPRSWHNIGNGEIRIGIMDILDSEVPPGSAEPTPIADRKTLTYKFNIPPGTYTDIETLLESVNKAFDELWKTLADEFHAYSKYMNVSAPLKQRVWVADRINELVRTKDSFRLEYEEPYMHLQIDRTFVRFVDFSVDLRYVLGFRTTSDRRASHKPKFDSHVSSLYVYVPIIHPQLISDVQACVIRVVPVRGEDGDLVDIDYPNVHYVDVLQRDFDSVEVYLRSEDGELIPFNDDRNVIVKLHFRKKRIF